MSNIKFTMKDLDGTVMPYTSFVISTSASANAASFTTNLNGEATVTLAAVSTPYYISKQDGTTESVIAYKFFVPDTTYTLDAELLFVDMGKISKDKNDKSIAALIEAKVVAVNAANRALQVANAAAASFDSFDDRYLGAKGVAPTVDNAGNVLLVGAKYFNSTENKMYVRNSYNAWQLDTADSSTVTYDDGTVQDVLDAVTGPNGAASIGYMPAGGLSSINVQTALVELDSEKQNTLVSGTNIKTINGSSILGSGNITISGGASNASSVTFAPVGNIASTSVQAAIAELDSEKQNTLVSGTSIKTINGASILGSGNIVIAGGTGTVPVKFLTDFGAVGDGSSSSIAANNAAIASALTYIYSTGFNVIVPPGTYICDPFEINHIGYAGQGTFIGIDRERCIFKRSLSSQGGIAFVTIGNPTNPSFQAGMGMSKIMIDGGPTTNGPAISIFNAARARFEECEFTGGSVACNIVFNITVTFATCIFRGSKIGIKIVNSNLLHFEGGEIVENTEIGMWVSGNRMISVSNVDVEGNGTTLGELGQGGIYIGPGMGQDVAINDTFSVGLIVDSCWFESNRGLADIHVRSGLTNIERSTFFSTSEQTTNDIRIEGGRYTVRSVNSSFTKTHNLYESSDVENGNIIMSSDLPGLNYDAMKTTVYGGSTIAMRGGSVPVATNILKPLIQGGSSTTDANGLLTVTFTTAYQFVPTAITCTPIDTIPGTLVGCSITSVSTTGFTAQIDYMGQSNTNPVVGSNMLISWISIGSGY